MIRGTKKTRGQEGGVGLEENEFLGKRRGTSSEGTYQWQQIPKGEKAETNTGTKGKGGRIWGKRKIAVKKGMGGASPQTRQKKRKHLGSRCLKKRVNRLEMKKGKKKKTIQPTNYKKLD